MNVYKAANSRITNIFNEFDNVVVAFSGGKDSGVMLNLCIDYVRNHAPNRRFSVMHLDYEAQYELTTKYVDETLSANADIIDVYRICVPFKVTTCTSMSTDHWRPWEVSKKDIWVRELPIIHHGKEAFSYYNEQMWDYEFQEKFSQWIHERNKAKKTACLVGIRTQESLNRWRAIHSDRNYKNYNGLKYSKQMYDDVYNFYPIYDWTTTDVWVANYKMKWSYNNLYDIFYQAGIGVEQQRVASPFISTAQDSLKLFKVIEPNTWGKLVSRVNGVNFTGLYGGTTAMGWQSIKLPQGHTWESYMYFLLSTLPELTKANYLAKLSTSMKFWREKGGVLSKEVVEKLKDNGVNITLQDSTNYATSKLPVRMEYIDEIDIAESKEIPTYKRMCICIMKNDHLCKYMGFTLTKNEMASRKNIIAKYQSIL